jgi:uncharacterized protein (DUF1501 family)
VSTFSRRDFLRVAAALPFAGSAGLALAADGKPRRLLILIELKGGNDGLNTVIPYADPAYTRLRPRIAIARDQVVQLDEATGLHPALAPLQPLWAAKELAVVQGLGYPDPNLSHFRSIEIWDTASKAEEYVASGWLARAFSRHPAPADFAADGVVIGNGGMGPLAGPGVRAIALANPEQFLRNARLARGEGESSNPALDHIRRVERDILASAQRLHTGRQFETVFPSGRFGNEVSSAAQLAANEAGIGVVRLTLNGFDTHANQQGVQANLLRQLAEGIVALKGALRELGKWDDTLIATYAEFGRRPRENQSGGTDHGTAAPHFVVGGRVKGGLYGAPPALERLDGNGNLPWGVDFRAYYATFLERWWSLPSTDVLGGKHRPLELLRT